jgi:hypothetical protein
MVFFKKIPFQRSYWLTSCTLGILQSHTLCPKAFIKTLITKSNLPHKYTKSLLCSEGTCSWCESTEQGKTGFTLEQALAEPSTT